MNKRMRKKLKVPPALALGTALALTVVMTAAAVTAVGDVGKTAGQQGKLLLENSLYRAAVSCYAIEGAYPPNLNYLTQNYGVVIDSEKYAVYYDIFADNLMPDITVISVE